MYQKVIVPSAVCAGMLEGAGGGKSYLEYIFISGATVCVDRHIGDHSVFFHRYCPHRHHHLLSSQNRCVQDLCVLQRGRANQPKSLHVA